MLKNNSRKTSRGILQVWQMIPITDPAEQAAIDSRCREAEKLLAGRGELKKPKPRKRK
jgi:hypothetical protein